MNNTNKIIVSVYIVGGILLALLIAGNIHAENLRFQEARVDRAEYLCQPTTKYKVAPDETCMSSLTDANAELICDTLQYHNCRVEEKK